jgi:hypothetical protein
LLWNNYYGLKFSRQIFWWQTHNRFQLSKLETCNFRRKFSWKTEVTFVFQIFAITLVVSGKQEKGFKFFKYTLNRYGVELFEILRLGKILHLRKCTLPISILWRKSWLFAGSGSRWSAEVRWWVGGKLSEELSPSFHRTLSFF